MSTQVLWLPGRLPGLNELLTAKGAGRGKYNGYARLKAATERDILAHIRAQRLQPVTGLAQLHYRWVEKDKRRDPSNVAAGGRKLIEDALVTAGVLRDDGWGEIMGWTDEFVVNRPTPGVRVWISSAS